MIRSVLSVIAGYVAMFIIGATLVCPENGPGASTFESAGDG